MGITNRGGFFQSIAGKNNDDAKTNSVPSLNESRKTEAILSNSEKRPTQQSFLTDPLSRKISGDKRNYAECAWAELRERMNQLKANNDIEQFMRPVSVSVRKP